MKNLLEVLKKYSNKEIILLGHDNPDCDSIISAFLISKLLDFKGIANKIIIPTEIDEETKNLLSFFKDNKCLNNLNNYKGSINEDDVVLLLDHNKTNYQCNVLGCIDHHPTIDTFEYDFYVNKSSSSTAKLVFHLMEEYNYPINKEIAEMVCFSVFIDTCSLKSTKCPEEDKVWVKNYTEEWGIDYDKLYEKGLILTDLSQNIYNIIKNGYKEYMYEGIKVCSSYIQINNNCEEDTINEFIKNLKRYFENGDMKLWAFLIIDFGRNQTREYRLSYKKLDIRVHDGILSRGANIMPNIQKNIKSLIKPY